MLNKLCSIKGQAFIEAVFILPAILLMILVVIWFGRILITWQQLVSASRYGTDMIANTNLNRNDIKKDIENYLTHRMIEGRRLDIDKIKEITVNINDYEPVGIEFSDITSIFNINKTVKSFVVPSAEKSSVKIIYAYDLPKIMRFTGQKEFNITVESDVLSGSGCLNKIHKRK